MTESEAKCAAMARGWGGTPRGRDLRLVKGELWERFRVPASPHHWTRWEFEQYLQGERVPGNTWDDRVAFHTERIARALMAGTAVPAEVMKDAAGIEALETATTRVMAMAEGAEKESARKANVRSLEQALGWWSPGGKPRSAMKQMLVSAANSLQRVSADEAGMWPARSLKRVTLNDFPGDLLIGLRLGACGGRWFSVRVSNVCQMSLYGELMRIEYGEGLALLKEAVEEARTDREGVGSLLGA